MPLKRFRPRQPDPFIGSKKGNQELARFAHLNYLIDYINTFSPGGVLSIASGTGITVDNTNPSLPIINFTGNTTQVNNASGVPGANLTQALNYLLTNLPTTWVESVSGTVRVAVDNTDPQNPIVDVDVTAPFNWTNQHAFTNFYPLSPGGIPPFSNSLTDKAYTDTFAQGLVVKASCDMATEPIANTDIVLAGEQVIDGVLTSSSRVLVKNQTTQKNNGIYVSAAGAWTRATDYDTTAEADRGTFTPIVGGTVNGNTLWVQLTNDPVINTDPLVFTQLAGGISPTASLGVQKVGNDFRANTDGSTIGLTGNQLTFIGGSNDVDNDSTVPGVDVTAALDYLLTNFPVRGNTLIVSKDGYASPPAAREKVTFHFSSIIDAWIQATPGDIIIVYPGAWNMLGAAMSLTNDITWYFMPGCTLSGSNLFGSLDPGFRLYGYADIVHSGNLVASNNIGKIVIECNSISCASFVMNTANNLLLTVRENLTCHGPMSFSNTGGELVQCNMKLKANKIICDNTSNTLGAAAITVGPYTGSLITIDADVYDTSASVNPYLSVYSFITNQNYLFKHNGDIYPQGTATAAVASASQYVYLFSGGIYVKGNIYIVGNNSRALNITAGSLTYSGKIYSDDNTFNVINVNEGGGNPSTLFLNDVEIYSNTTGGALAATGIIYVNSLGSVENKIICNNLKIIAGDTSYDAINSAVASSKIVIYDGYGNCDISPNMLNVIGFTAWGFDVNCL